MYSSFVYHSILFRVRGTSSDQSQNSFGGGGVTVSTNPSKVHKDQLPPTFFVPRIVRSVSAIAVDR